MFRVVLALGLIAGAAGSAAAEDVLKRPESCVLVATAQYDDCTVDNQFSCVTAEEHSYRTETFGASGLEMLWTENWESRTGELKDFTDPDAGDMRFRFEGGDLEEAIKTGWTRGSFEVDVEDVDGWFTLQADETYVHDAEIVELAGASFAKVKRSEVMHDEGTNWRYRTESVLLYNMALDLVVMEESRSEDSPVTRLVSLALPGQPGFGSESPTHGCLETSGLTADTVEVPA